MRTVAVLVCTVADEVVIVIEALFVSEVGGGARVLRVVTVSEEEEEEEEEEPGAEDKVAAEDEEAKAEVIVESPLRGEAGGRGV